VRRRVRFRDAKGSSFAVRTLPVRSYKRSGCLRAQEERRISCSTAKLSRETTSGSRRHRADLPRPAHGPWPLKVDRRRVSLPATRCSSPLIPDCAAPLPSTPSGRRRDHAVRLVRKALSAKHPRRAVDRRAPSAESAGDRSVRHHNQCRPRSNPAPDRPSPPTRTRDRKTHLRNKIERSLPARSSSSTTSSLAHRRRGRRALCRGDLIMLAVPGGDRRDRAPYIAAPARSTATGGCCA